MTTTPDPLKLARDALASCNSNDGDDPWYDAEKVRSAIAAIDALPAGVPSGEPVDPLTLLQVGFNNAELLAQWRKKLPGVEPTDRELSAFAVGTEVGWQRAAAQAAPAPAPTADGGGAYGVALLAAWDAVRDPGPGGDAVPHPTFCAGFGAAWAARTQTPAAPAVAAPEPQRAALAQAGVPEGWQWVPVEPTPWMLQALFGYWLDCINSPKQRITATAEYKAMLTAAAAIPHPSPAQREPLSDAEIAALHNSASACVQFLQPATVRQIARAIERAHGITTSGTKGAAS